MTPLAVTDLSPGWRGTRRDDPPLPAIPRFRTPSRSCRRLAAANTAAYETDLAMSLNNLSNHLAAAGRRNESERASEEASELGTHGAQ